MGKGMGKGGEGSQRNRGMIFSSKSSLSNIVPMLFCRLNGIEDDCSDVMSHNSLQKPKSKVLCKI